MCIGSSCHLKGLHDGGVLSEMHAELVCSCCLSKFSRRVGLTVKCMRKWTMSICSTIHSMPSFHNIQQFLRGVGMNTVSVLSCSIINQKISKPISHWKPRVTSDLCVILEDTHRSKLCCGLGVHTVSFAWCKCTRDGTTPVVASGNAHMHACFFGLLMFSYLLQYSTQLENYIFLQWVDPPAIDPY
jgi:hypothetical protein